jgi:hypothetical protein
MTARDEMDDTTETPMGPSLDAWNVIGYTALLVTLLMSSPGVRVVRADESLSSSARAVSEGPMCSAGQPIDDRELATVFETLRQDLARQAQAPNSNLPIALNNRGYGYGPPSEAALLAIRDQIGMVLRER